MQPHTPSSHEPDNAEIARRLRAAMAYRNRTREHIGQLLGIKPRTVSRCMSETDPRTLTTAAQWYLSARLRLPREWWTADFSRLAEIAPREQPTVPDDATSSLGAALREAGQDFRRPREDRSQTDASKPTTEEAE